MKAFSLFILLTFQSLSFSQNNAIVIAETIEIQSEVLNEERTIFISLPDDYDTITEALPVIYILDAEYRFKVSHGIYSYMRYWNGVPNVF